MHPFLDNPSYLLSRPCLVWQLLVLYHRPRLPKGWDFLLSVFIFPAERSRVHTEAQATLAVLNGRTLTSGDMTNGSLQKRLTGGSTPASISVSKNTVTREGGLFVLPIGERGFGTIRPVKIKTILQREFKASLHCHDLLESPQTTQALPPSKFHMFSPKN